VRDEIDLAIARGDAGAAVRGLGRLFREQPTSATAAFVNAGFDALKGSTQLAPLRLAIVRSFTIEPLVPLLRARCLLAGIDPVVHLGPFNVIDQLLLDGAELAAFRPDAVIVAALTADVAPALWRGEPGNADDERHAAERIREWMAGLRRWSPVPLIVQSFEEPPRAADGVLDAQRIDGQRTALRRLNATLLAAAREHRDVYVLDYDALVAAHGRQTWRDPHKHLALRVPMRAEAFGWLAEEYMRFLHPLTGRTCKAVAVDLDDTLWGGIVGEVGVDGVQVGPEYPGAAYLEFQRALQSLARRGVLLAICSKNNPDEAMAVLRDHKEMLLRPDDFAAIRTNWDDKAQNLRSIAEELNIGVESLAFVDDNPVEREWVRTEMPGVTVIDLPADPVLYADALLRAPVFERLSSSDEDRARGRQYREQKERAVVQQTAGSVDAFLASLAMVATLADVGAGSLPRIAQLTQKTNQFNLTTKRYTEEEIARLSRDDAAIVRSIRIVDRFGDNGLVGVAIARTDGDRCEIETFLLSCRVIGRRVETVLLADVAREARRRGARTLAGWYRPTSRNAPAADFYARHRFERAREEHGASLWELDLSAADIAVPDWIACT
jgi:FkbH-like protein